MNDKGWLDKIVQPTALSLRTDIPKTISFKRFVDPQVKRLRDVAEFVEAGKWASAAHALREHRLNNPWIKKDK